jgi:predicted DCC family thiol-disulfide oxidoreductase YuxK
MWDRGGRLRPVPIQGEEGQELLAEVAPAARLDSFHLVAPGRGRVSGGAALPALLRLLPGGGPVAAVLAAAPGTTEKAYGWVARHRVGISRFVPRAVKRRARRRLDERAGALSAG